MNRFFVSSEQINDEYISIIGDDVKHIRDVLRLKIGDIVEVSCRELVYLSKIFNMDNNEVLLKILETKKGMNEPPIDIYLYQGIPKSNKMDLIIQKSTEIGVKEIYPIITNRTIVKIKDRKKEKKKVNRWNKICMEAAKQSKRDNIPKVNEILSFEEMIELIKGEELIIAPYEREEKIGIKNILKENINEKIHLIIGPEGGFEEEEIEQIEKVGGKIVTLGPRILRTETAGLVALTILMYELGDMGVMK